MSFSIRPVLTTLGLARPDVASAMLMFAAQEGARRVCRKTHLATVTYEWTITLGTNSVQISMPADKGFLRVMRAVYKSASASEWTELEEVAFQDALDNRSWVGSGANQQYFSQQGGTIIVYKTPTENGTLRASVSYVPIDEFETVPLPEQASLAVTDAAMALAYAIPGPGQSLQASANHDRAFRRGVGGLRAMAFIGEGGSPSFEMTPFM